MVLVVPFGTSPTASAFITWKIKKEISPEAPLNASTDSQVVFPSLNHVSSFSESPVSLQGQRGPIYQLWLKPSHWGTRQTGSPPLGNSPRVDQAALSRQNLSSQEAPLQKWRLQGPPRGLYSKVCSRLWWEEEGPQVCQRHAEDTLAWGPYQVRGLAGRAAWERVSGPLLPCCWRPGGPWRWLPVPGGQWPHGLSLGWLRVTLTLGTESPALNPGLTTSGSLESCSGPSQRGDCSLERVWLAGGHTGRKGAERGGLRPRTVASSEVGAHTPCPRVTRRRPSRDSWPGSRHSLPSLNRAALCSRGRELAPSPGQTSLAPNPTLTQLKNSSGRLEPTSPCSLAGRQDSWGPLPAAWGMAGDSWEVSHCVSSSLTFSSCGTGVGCRDRIRSLYLVSVPGSCLVQGS